MFIAYSTTTEKEAFLVKTKLHPCKKCGNEELFVLHKETTTYKLFWFIPIFKLKSFYLTCNNCGKGKMIKKAEGEDLIKYNLYTEEENAKIAEQSGDKQEVFDEFTDKKAEEITVAEKSEAAACEVKDESTNA